MADLAAETARQIIQEGREFTQYVRNDTGVEKKSIFLFYESAPTSSLGSLHWCATGSRVVSPENCLHLALLTGILMNKQTQVLRSDEAQEAQGECCFSVLAKDQDLDLEAESREVVETFALGIESLMAAHCVTKVQHEGATDLIPLPHLATPPRTPSNPPLTPVVSHPIDLVALSAAPMTPSLAPAPSAAPMTPSAPLAPMTPSAALATSLATPSAALATPKEEDPFSATFEFKTTLPLMTPAREAPSPLNTRGLRTRMRPSLTRESLLLGEFRSAEEVFNKSLAEPPEGPRLKESLTRLSMVNFLALKEKRVQELQSKIDRLAGSLASPVPKQLHSARAATRSHPRIGGSLLTNADMKELIQNLKKETEYDLDLLKGQMETSVLSIANAMNLQKKRMLALEDNLRAETKRRKAAVEKVLDLQGSIRVFCRVRPLMPKELSEGDNAIIKVDQEDSLVMTVAGENKRFSYDHIFGPQSTQEQVFSEVSPLVDACIGGYTVCIFAYGQTGSGKTHTMEGSKNDRGVNYRALQYLFETCADDEAQNPHLVHQVNVSVVEIYMEEVRDLLSQQGPGVRMEIREGADGVYIPGLEERVVTSVEQVQDLMIHEAYPNRQVRGTSMNDRSSRSHCLVFVRCTVTSSQTNVKTVGSLILIDLAGSERLKKSEAVGEAMKEAQAINKSLSALGNVIAALQQRNAHIPFRDSKLTFLLQNSLGGSCKCLMFCQIGPAASNHQETSCSLTFANRVRATKLGQAKKNFAAEVKTVAEPCTPVSNKMKEQMKSMEQTLKSKTDLVSTLEARVRECEQEIASFRDRDREEPVAEKVREKPRTERVLQPSRTNEPRREFVSSIHSETTRDTKKKVAPPVVSKTRASVREVKAVATAKEIDSPEKDDSPRRKRKTEDAETKDKENEVTRPPTRSSTRSKSLSHVHKKPKQSVRDRAKKVAVAATLVPGTMGRSKRF